MDTGGKGRKEEHAERKEEGGRRQQEGGRNNNKKLLVLTVQPFSTLTLSRRPSSLQCSVSTALTADTSKHPTTLSKPAAQRRCSLLCSTDQ